MGSEKKGAGNAGVGLVVPGGVVGRAESQSERRARRQARPRHTNLGLSDLMTYRMAPASIVSILHRISGVLLFLVGIPFILYLFQNSLTSELSFQTYRAAVSSWLGKLLLLALIWAFLHHLIAGLRFLVLDLHVGTDRVPATQSAWGVLGVSVFLTLVCAAMLFGLF